jgi:hypothetical protein
MRCAVVVSASDLSLEVAGGAHDAIARLSAALGQLGFRVVLVEDAADVLERLSQAISGLAPGDDLLLCVSGRLTAPGELRTEGGGSLPLSGVGDVLAAGAGTHVSIVAELFCDDGPTAGHHVESVASALGARERGYALLAAVAPLSLAAQGLTFTSLLLNVAKGEGGAGAPLSVVYDRVLSLAGAELAAHSHAFVPGSRDLCLSAPAPVPDLDALIAAATDSRDWARVVELRRERLRTHTGPRARVRELVAIARVQQAELGEAENAIDSLEQARAVDSRRVPVLQALRRGYETLGRWASAIEIAGVLADLAPATAERAALRFAQARMALDHLQDEDRAAVWLEQVLEDDPSHVDARNALALLRTVSAADPLPSLPEPPPVVIGPPAVVLVAEPAPEPAFVSPAVGSATDVEPASIERETLAVAATPAPVPLLPSEPPPPMTAPDEPAPTAPGAQGFDELSPAAYDHAFATFEREGKSDAAFLAALALEALGAVHPGHRALLDRLRTVAPLRARGTLDNAAWALLRPPESDDVLRDLFASVAKAGMVVQTDQLASAGRLVALDPETRLDGTSTASSVRSFQWAARVLGVPCPQLHAVDVVPGEIAAVRRHQPTTAIGPSIMSGRSAKDLAFLAGRHLAYYLPEHQMLVYFPTREELTRLFLACIQLARPGLPTDGEAARAVAGLAGRLDARITPQDRAALRHAVHRLEARGGRFSLSAFARHAELIAARAGLFLCGDLATALGIVRTESRSIAGVTLEAKERDLISFCASAEHAALRERCAFTAPEAHPATALRAS